MHHPRLGVASSETVLSKTVLLTALLTTLAVVVPGASAQDDEARRHGIFLDSLDVSLINLEVMVTARDGAPVADLTIDDFEILDDGVPVEVTHFSRVEDGHPVAEEPPEGEPAEGPVREPRVRDPSVILILVDQAFISSVNRKLVFDRLAEHLETLLSANTQVMVVAKDRTVEVEQPLTPHRGAVLEALDRLNRQAVPDYSTELRRVLRNVERGRVSIEPEDASFEGPTSAETEARAGLQEARLFSQEVHANVLHSLKLLRGFLGALAGLPGRKAVIYVADRLPTRPGELVWQAWFDQYGDNWGWQLGVTSAFEEVSRFDTSRWIRELIATAGANRVAFYPIGGRIGDAGLSGAANAGLRRVTESAHLSDTASDGLVWLARDTGGQAALDSRGKKHLFDQLRSDLSDFYSLGYPSPHRGDGESHEVEVRVRRDGVKVRYLSRYQDKSPRQEAEERLLASLVLDVGENPLDVKAAVGPPEERPEGRFRVPLQIEIPIANLLLVPGRKSHAAKVSIQVMVRDEQGGLSDPVEIDLPFEVPHGAILQALTESLTYSTWVTLRPGRQTIAIGVHDKLGLTTSTVNVGADVGSR